MRALTATLTLFLTLSVAGACVDTSPLRFEREIADAASDAPKDDPACRECISGENGGCAQEYARCAIDPICVGVLDCVLTAGCFASSQLQDRIACATPCLKEFGVTDNRDPLIYEVFLPLNVCSLAGGACARVCLKGSSLEGT